MIKYLGSKRKLIPAIVAAVNATKEVKHVLDLFSGTSRVGHALKKEGYFVSANDHNAYAYAIATCYVEANKSKIHKECTALIEELSHAPSMSNKFSKTYSQDSRYFQQENAERIAGIRDALEHKILPFDIKAVALTSLMEAADRVDSTTGVQMAYLKSWAKRSFSPLALRMPDILPGEGRAIRGDATEVASGVDADLVYLDPPYNQHSYRGNYHIWETLTLWDEPETYGVAEKRVDVRTKKSDYNSKRKIKDALAKTLEACAGKKLLVSFSNEGFLDSDEIQSLLSEYGHVDAVAIDYKRYVGAQIGIHNPSGEKVGEVSHLRNKELLFYCAKNKDEVKQVCSAITKAITPQ